MKNAICYFIELEINTLHLPPGTYFLYLKTSGGERRNFVFHKI